MAWEYVLSFHLETAHRTNGFPEGHPNSQIHGHSYQGEWFVVGDTDENGFVLEIGEAQRKLKEVVAKYDHKFLNDIEGLENPSAENIAKVIYEDLKLLESRTTAVQIIRPTIGMRTKYPAEKA